MHNHFDQYLNLKQWILNRGPKVVVECGAGKGELTRKLSSLIDQCGFELHVISDAPISGLDERIQWKTGLSYKALNDFPAGSIDICIIDTDHNYWTLTKELSVLFDRMSEGGLIAMHDVETFYHDTGMAMSYWDGEEYPKEEIEKCASQGGLGDALIDFLQHKHMNFKLLAYTAESHGAAMIEKKTSNEFVIYVPGPQPEFAKPLEAEKEPVHV